MACHNNTARIECGHGRHRGDPARVGSLLQRGNNSSNRLIKNNLSLFFAPWQWGSLSVIRLISTEKAAGVFVIKSYFAILFVTDDMMRKNIDTAIVGT